MRKHWLPVLLLAWLAFAIPAALRSQDAAKAVKAADDATPLEIPAEMMSDAMKLTVPQVADLVKARDDERLEHAPRSKRRSSAQTLRLRFWKTRQHGRKEAPVDDLIESCQRVTHLMQFLQSDGFVEEAALVGLNILGHRV